MIQKLSIEEMPACLRRIPSPPKQLFVRSADSSALGNLMRRPRVALVGSRNMTTYGKAVASKFATELAAHGVVVVSGLAIGIDAVAHRSILEAGGLALAVLPGPVERIYPRSHESLALKLLASGGVLVSEYPEGAITYKPNFVARNRIVTGLADALLIVEAADNSGTIHTADFALDQGKEVLAVPGNINSPTSVGTNRLIKTGATPITCTADILRALGMNKAIDRIKTFRTIGSNADEQLIIDLLEQGVSDGNQLLTGSGFSVELFNHHLTMLEITAKIRPLGANHWALS